MNRCYNPDCSTGSYGDGYDKCPSCNDEWEYDGNEDSNNSFGYGDGSGYDS